MAGKMLKFIRGKGQQPSAERQKLHQELFAFRKTVQHGFPNGACALAWDPLLRLMCIGTTSGALKIYGTPGVELYGQHSDATITNLYFIHGAGRIVSLCDDNSLHLWEITDNSLVELKCLTLEGKQKRISSVCIEVSGAKALLGTEGGNVYSIDLETFTCADEVIYLEQVMENCSEQFKVSPGAVECLSESPNGGPIIVLGYARGLLAIWDRETAEVRQTIVVGQQLESLCWSNDGRQISTSHNDGSFVTWDVHESGNSSTEDIRREPLTPYGPYACKGVTKLLMRTSHNGEELIIYSGGMPRSSYGDKYTVTAQQANKQVAFDFTSRVIDMFTTSPRDDSWRDTKPKLANKTQTVSQVADALIVLAEEELVVIDLNSPTWKTFRLPYLVSVHASAITAVHLVDHVADNVYTSILEAGLKQTENMYTTSSWPIDGGKTEEPVDNSMKTDSEDGATSKLLLLTGHEDGSVRFWDVTTVTMKPLYTFTTSELFSGDEALDVEKEPLNADNEDDEEWPPFRRVGAFDPYSDDPRLALKKVWLCGLSGQLVVAGAAGHILVSKLGSDASTVEVKPVAVNIVSDRDGFVWKGHDKLSMKQGPITFQPGFQAVSCIQLHPPAAVTALSVQPEWDVLAAGSAHGLALVDTKHNKLVLHKCTLHPLDGIGAGEVISRRKSFKKSLRESFRRLRKGRSQRRRTAAAGTENTVVNKRLETAEPEAKPIERPVEARPTDDGLGSMIRSLYMARAHLINAQNTTPSLWAGTNNGTVYAFTINVPANNKRKDEVATGQLAKEIQLKHRAPVVGIAVLDAASVPLPQPVEVERGICPLPDTTGPQRVLLASEEQFKLFTLPSLKPFCKYKLTAHEGARVRRVAFAWFTPNYCCLLCLTNLGDCLVLGLPELKRLLNAAAVRKEDINGISSLVFSRYGEAFYLHSSSELQRITVSATKVTKPKCHIEIASWAQQSPIVAQSTTFVQEQPQLHDVTAASADITVDSVKDHTTNQPDAQINLQDVTVSESSVVVKTTTRSPPPENGAAAGDHVLEHSREEGVITRVESGTVTVPAGTDPKLILEMLERSRTPLAAPTPTPH